MFTRMLDRPRIAAICARTGMLFAWAALAQGSDFYVAEQGDDASSGESPRLAWRSIERVNRHRFQPGDRLLFESGQTFHGNLYLSATNAAPDGTLVVTTAGDAPARILAGDGTGVRVHNLAGITIKNLLIEGSGRTNNTGYGIWCENRLATGERLQHLRVEQVEVSGFGIFGILITGTKAGFEHVVVTQSTMRDNLRGGMEIAGQLPYDSPSYAHQDVQVTHCRAYSNTGDPTYLKNHSGSGIVLYQVDGGLIDHCVAWNNGALCRSSGGGVGLWACASRGVTIQHCESFANRTSGADGGGFDLDGGSVECVLQFNYSHDNDGPGLMIYSYPYASHRDHGNVVRFNLSENDSRKSRRYAGLWVQTDGPEITGLEIYNNTIYTRGAADQAAYLRASSVTAQLRNNIFWGADGTIPLQVDRPAEGNLRFEQNLYWSTDAPVQIRWGSRNYAALTDWRRETGQETLGGDPLGLWADPRLSNHGSAHRPGKIIGLPNLKAFWPTPGSPCRGNGLDLRARFGLQVGRQDLLGEALPANEPLPVGAIAGRTSSR